MCVCLSGCAGAYSRRRGRARTRWAGLGPWPRIHRLNRLLSAVLTHVCGSLPVQAPTLQGWGEREGAGLSSGGGPGPGLYQFNSFLGPIKCVSFSSLCLACAYVFLSVCVGTCSSKLGRARTRWAGLGQFRGNSNFLADGGGQGEVWRLAAGSRPAWRAEGSTPHPISEISNFGPLTRTAPQTPIPWDIRKRGASKCEWSNTIASICESL